MIFFKFLVFLIKSSPKTGKDSSHRTDAVRTDRWILQPTYTGLVVLNAYEFVSLSTFDSVDRKWSLTEHTHVCKCTPSWCVHRLYCRSASGTINAFQPKDNTAYFTPSAQQDLIMANKENAHVSLNSFQYRIFGQLKIRKCRVDDEVRNCDANLKIMGRPIYGKGPTQTLHSDSGTMTWRLLNTECFRKISFEWSENVENCQISGIAYNSSAWANTMRS